MLLALEEVLAEIVVDCGNAPWWQRICGLNDTVVISGAGGEAVLRETDSQTTIWEALLLKEAKRLPAELAKVDAHLDNEQFIARGRALFSKCLGCPSTPAAAAVSQAPLPARLRDPVPRGRRLDLIAVVLPAAGSADGAVEVANQAVDVLGRRTYRPLRHHTSSLT